MNAAAREASRPDHPVSVLIVDDVSDTREMYAFYFRKQGFTVFTALDGRNGLDVVMATSRALRPSSAVKTVNPCLRK